MKKQILFLIFGIVFLFGMINFASAWNSTFSNGLVHAYNFNEGTGTNTLDAITGANQTNGTLLGGASFVTNGKNGYGIKIPSGNFQGVNISGDKWFNGTNALTFCGWINVSSIIGEGYGFALYGSVPNDKLRFIEGSGNDLYWAFGGGGGEYLTYTSIDSYNLGIDTFYCGVKNTTSTEIWINGNLKATGGPLVAGITRPASLYFGCFDGGTNCAGANGNIISAYYFWDRSLTQGEIQSLYNGGNGVFYLSGGNPSLSVTLDFPANNTLTSSTAVNFSAHYTYTNMDITNATYYVYNQNGSIFNRTTVSVSPSVNSTNLTIFGLNLGTVYKWNIYSCGTNATATICSWESSGNFTFIIVAFSETSVSYNNSIHEMKRQNFTLIIAGNPTISSASANFWYNGTRYSSSITDETAGIYRASSVIDISLQNNVGGTGNKTFFWEWIFTLTNGNTINQNSTAYSHEVNRTYIYYCNATYTTQFINFTTRSATNPFPKNNATFKVSWNYGFNTEGIRRSIPYEDVTEALNNWKFCMSPNEIYYTSANIEYDANGYAQNYYYLDNAVLTNNTNAINLYLLNDTLATVTEIITQDNIQNPIANITFQIQLYDIGTNTFYTVGMGKTSWDGKDITYLNWYSTLYKFIFTKNGQVLKTTEPYKISATPQTFTISEAVSQGFEKFRDFVYNLYYNNNTKNFVLTFTKPNGLVDQGCLRVIKRTSSADSQICLVCESSSSATVYCNIGSSGNGTFIAHFYATGSWYDLEWIETTIGASFAETIYDLLGNEDATAYAFLFSGVVFSMFFLSPVLAIIGLILGILGGAALGFTILNYTTFIGIAIVGGVIIWLVKR